MVVYTVDGNPFQIDETDYLVVSRRVWRMRSDGRYVVNGRVLLHIFLMGKAPSGFEWDHRNRDKMDNRRENLRAVTHTVNVQNTSVRSSSSTGFAGINFHAGRTRPWRARIGVQSGQLDLGYFTTREEAISARTEAEKKYRSLVIARDDTVRT